MSDYADSKKCAEFGLDTKKVESVARRLVSAAKEARKLGLIIFGGSGTGSLRYVREESGTRSEVAWLGEGFDGGDGGDE